MAQNLCSRNGVQLSELDSSWDGLATQLARSSGADVQQALLNVDLWNVKRGGFPENLDELHGTTLPGSYLLQVDELVDVSASQAQRYKTTRGASQRFLKLLLTDGTRSVTGFEFRTISALGNALPGVKLVVKQPMVRRGILLLDSSSTKVLGGCVDSLKQQNAAVAQNIENLSRHRVELPAHLQALVPNHRHNSATGNVPPAATANFSTAANGARPSSAVQRQVNPAAARQLVPDIEDMGGASRSQPRRMAQPVAPVHHAQQPPPRSREVQQRDLNRQLPQTAPARTDDGSLFKNCPRCGVKVALSDMNHHLDLDCRGPEAAASSGVGLPAVQQLLAPKLLARQQSKAQQHTATAAKVSGTDHSTRDVKATAGDQKPGVGSDFRTAAQIISEVHLRPATKRQLKGELEAAERSPAPKQGSVKRECEMEATEQHATLNRPAKRSKQAPWITLQDMLANSDDRVHQIKVVVTDIVKVDKPKKKDSNKLITILAVINDGTSVQPALLTEELVLDLLEFDRETFLRLWRTDKNKVGEHWLKCQQKIFALEGIFDARHSEGIFNGTDYKIALLKHRQPNIGDLRSMLSFLQ